MMQNCSMRVKNKHYLMLCELHHPGRHGKTEDSDPNIETHYLVYDTFEPITGISLDYLDNCEELDTDNEYDSDDDIENRELININNEIMFLKEMYSNPINFNSQYFETHPKIRNYHSIVLAPNYIKAEIGEYIILPTQEAIAILKTFWLRIIQRKWKKVFQERKNIVKQRCHLSNLLIREIHGIWPDSCLSLPSLRGMLYQLKT